MVVDALGLVESWVCAAEDWLAAWDGAEYLSPSDAFEGVEHLGRLSRCRCSLLEEAAGSGVLSSLKHFFDADQHKESVMRATEFPDVDGWLAQARQAWDAYSDSLDLARQLLEDIDSLDFLTWYVEYRQFDIDAAESWVAIQKNLTQCHLWLDRHAVFFVIAEPYIRAVAKTIPEDLRIDEPTGLLALSAAKYIRLLDECEWAQEDFARPATLEILRDQVPLGGVRLDYNIREMAHAAGAPQQLFVPTAPCLWRDPTGRYQAMLFLPEAVVPGGDAELEILFGTGDGFFEPALELAGAALQLGNAIGTVERRTQGGAELVFAKIPLHAVTSTEVPTVNLVVNGERWLQ
jgi:hypothetical protein